MTATPRPPAHVAPFVECLGFDRAITFLLAFGGAPIYLAGRPQATNRLLPVIGADGVAALRREFGNRIDRVPQPKIWLARVWYARGIPVLDIARRLHTTDKTVRIWLKDDRHRAASAAEEARELRLAEKAKQIDIEEWIAR